MLTGLTGLFEFLINIVFQILGFIFMFRFFMRLVGIDYYHPMFQMINRFTYPIINPLLRVIPSYRTFETASFLILILLSMIKLTLEALLGGSPFPHVLGLFLWALGDLASSMINFFVFLIVINAIMSWLSPAYNPAVDVILRLCEPLLRPVRRFVPMLAGFDISPLIVIVLLLVLDYMVVQPYTNFAVRLAF
jgi:YggT family protein